MIIACRALSWNRKATHETKRAADEAQKSANAAIVQARAAEEQVSLQRARPLVIAGFSSTLGSAHSTLRGFLIKNIGNDTAFDVQIDDLCLGQDLSLQTKTIEFLAANSQEQAIHAVAKQEVTRAPQNSVPVWEFISRLKDARIGSLPVTIRYRSLRGQDFVTRLELRLNRERDEARIHVTGSLAQCDLQSSS